MHFHRCLIFILLGINICLSAQERIEFQEIISDQIPKGTPVVDVVEDNNHLLWFASWNGLFSYDGYHFTAYYHIPGDSNSIAGNKIIGLFKKMDGNILIGTDRGVSEINPVNFKIKQIFTPLPGYDYQRFFTECFEEDSTNIYMGTILGLIRLNKESGECSLHRPDYSFPNSMNPYLVMSMKQDNQSDSILFLGTNYGLIQYNKFQDRISVIENPHKNHPIYPEIELYSIWDIDQDMEGHLYVAAQASGGLMKVTVPTNNWQRLTGALNINAPYDGNRINAVTVINNVVYFSNWLGLGYYSEEAESIKYLKTVDINKTGLIRRIFVDHKGIVWLPGRRQINKSEPLVILENYPVKSQIWSFRVQNDNIDLRQAISLPTKPGKVAVRIGVNNPLNPETQKLRYKLLGDSPDWIELEGKNVIEFERLRSGKYILKHAILTNENTWEDGEDLVFKVEYPFYLRWPFVASSLIAIALLFYIGMRVSARRARREAAIKHEYEVKLAEAELESLRSQMNPHFIFNSLNSIYNFILQNEGEKATEYLAMFSKLMRQVLQNSKKKFISLKEEIDVLSLYMELEQIRFEKKMDYTISIDPKLSLDNLLIPPMMVQPHIENSIWHGIMHSKKKGMLQLSLYTGKNLLFIEVEDNGVGRKASKEIENKGEHKTRKSLGLTIAKDRLNHINHVYEIESELAIVDIKDTNGEPVGTKVILTLPLIPSK